MRYLMIIMLLGGCELVDQAGHKSLGYAMACSRVPYISQELAVEKTMEWAREREDDQHPGRCGNGCQSDLESWEKGAIAGAKCKIGD